ncbi:MAG TPA: TonB-dependent receptor, partial [Puia sp.]|nr:TonB-dependent receptor [Puia sp.]
HGISLNLKNSSLENALKEAFDKQPLTYKIQGNTIFVSVRQNGNKTKDSETNNIKIVYGNVSDSANKAIANASVSMMNRSKTVITGEDGNFRIQVRKEDSILLVTSIGYNKKEVKIISGFLHVVMNENINPLEQVVVGGNMTAIRRKAETTSLTVIDSKTLDALPVNNISQIYRGMVPGTNSFSPGDLVEEATTLSIRGTGLTGQDAQIAVYIDGIEFAGGSGYLFALNKQNIDRVEVLRGPSSSTLYGTGSNGGIIQVYTKQPVPGQSSLNFTASAGFLRSKWVHSDPFQQFYNLESVSGLKKAAVTIGGTYSSYDAFLPDGGGKMQTIYAGVKWNPSDKFTTDFIVQYENTRHHVSRNPEYDTAIHPNAAAIANNFGPTRSPHTDVDIESYLIGINITYQTTSHWTNHLTAGYTQNGYNQIPATNDSGNINLGPHYLITMNKATTLRYFNDLQCGANTTHGFNLHIMSGLEYKKYFYQEAFISQTYAQNLSGDPPDENYGIFAQANPSYKNIFLTLALRYDHNRLFKNDGSLNPRIGITTNFNIDNALIVKPRIAWGSGITAPYYASRYGDPTSGVVPNPDIKPVDQRGFEYGLEFFGPKGRFNLETVYYDNLLENFQSLNSIPPSGSTSLYQWMNVGSVANTGWEFSAFFKANDHFSMRGTFSVMSSVIKDTTGVSQYTYLGGMGPGSQVRNLPRHTAGLFLTYNASTLPVLKGRLDISFNITEVDGIIGFDSWGFLADLGYGRTSLSTPNLQNAYWKKSGMLIQLGLNVDYFINNNLRFFIQGSNIANNNTFEETSASPTYGASWMFGIKYNVNH